jgi:hypothetical protein
MVIMKLTFYDTESHGYLRVSLSFLKTLDCYSKISGYSGRDARYAYLEEDRDASLFVEELKQKNIQFEVESIYNPKFNKTHNF